MSKLDKLNTLIKLELLEQGAQQQVYNILDLECLIQMVVLPDAHPGYFMPIGGIALLDNYISPEMVGYDIGCGMCYIDTKVPVKDIFKKDAHITHMFNDIYRKIPIGVGANHKDGRDYDCFKSGLNDKDLDKEINKNLNVQLGTLGSGNHFIEIGKTQAGTVAITIHSGSRGVGYKLAEYYMKRHPQLIPFDSDLGQAYYQDMYFMLEYALDNRKLMMWDIIDLLGIPYQKKHSITSTMVNENHNHAIDTGNGILHRKGATPADKDQIGIIPANMRDGVFVTKGLGNKTYLSSASHGAGRTMSRGKARKSIDLQKFKNTMKGIVAKVKKETIDESPYAYKNINDVIAAQAGIVIDIVDRVKPIINIK